MKKFNKPLLDGAYLTYRMIDPILDPIRLLTFLPNYGRYVHELFRYSQMQGAEPFHLMNAYPKLDERTVTSGFGYGIHYLYQDVWAFRKIYRSRAKHHYDMGSNVIFVTLLTAITKVTFVDLRPLTAKLKNLDCRKGDLLQLPFRNNSLPSLSCLHVAEHCGLGRYGDSLDPQGTEKACRELARVLAPRGNLYFSVPVGKPRLCFNAHRVLSPTAILRYFSGLTLVEFSGVDDEGNFRKKIHPKTLQKSDYACGLFLFTKT